MDDPDKKIVKVLSIVWYKVWPPEFGGQKGIAFFNTYLARIYPLVCLCSKNNEPEKEPSFTIMPALPVRKTQFINPFVWRKIRLVAERENISHIIIEHPYHGFAANRVKRINGSKLIVHSHNIESERFRQQGKWWWRLLRRYERWTHGKADLNLFKTEADRDFAIRKFGLQPEKCLIVPYGIKRIAGDENAGQLIKQRHGIDKEAKIFLFAGTLDYAPNAEAVKNIYENLVPLLEKKGVVYKILVCGRNRLRAFQYLNRLSHKNVIIAGEVTDINNYFYAADVFINPVQTGTGIQTKNIDALAHHCPVVCFEQMREGIPAEICGSKLLTASNGDWEQFTHLILQAVQKKEPAPDAFFAYFDWENILEPVAEKMKSL